MYCKECISVIKVLFLLYSLSVVIFIAFLLLFIIMLNLYCESASNKISCYSALILTVLLEYTNIPHWDP